MKTSLKVETLYVIQEFISKHGYSPTVRELADVLGLASVSSMHFRLKELAAEGLITWVPSQARTIRVTDDGA